MPNENTELRSEAVQNIIGYIPHWIIRWGITVIFLIVLVLLVGSWFFKYPDVILPPLLSLPNHHLHQLWQKAMAKLPIY